MLVADVAPPNTLRVQLPPLLPGQLRVAVSPARYRIVQCGRRWGKTTLAVVTAWAEMLRGGGVMWIAPTFSKVLIGWRMMLRLAREMGEMVRVRAGEMRIECPLTGGFVGTSSADSGTGIRGEGATLAVLDEAAYIRDLGRVLFEETLPALMERRGRVLLTSTPSPRRGDPTRGVFRALCARASTDSDWGLFRYKSYEGAARLDDAEALRRVMPEAVYRREVLGEFVDDETGLWSWEMIDGYRVTAASSLQRIVVAVDPAVSSGADSAETGIIIAGIDGQRPPHAYILADSSLRADPQHWPQQVVAAYRQYRASYVLYEANQGGDLVRYAIQQTDASVPMRAVTAARNKQARAEPVAMLYGQGRVHHVGIFSDLESQMCSWTPDDTYSPDRLDALVWAVTELLLQSAQVSVSIGGRRVL